MGGGGALPIKDRYGCAGTGVRFFRSQFLLYKQTGHKPGKLRKCEKLSKTQGIFFIFVEKPGKLKEIVKHVSQSSMKVYENVFLREVSKYPGNLREFSFLKCGRPV